MKNRTVHECKPIQKLYLIKKLQEFSKRKLHNTLRGNFPYFPKLQLVSNFLSIFLFKNLKFLFRIQLFSSFEYFNSKRRKTKMAYFILNKTAYCIEHHHQTQTQIKYCLNIFFVCFNFRLVFLLIQMHSTAKNVRY